MPVKFDDFIKAPNSECEYTVEQIQELYRCSQDIEYFLKYVTIISLDEGKIKFNPYPFQREMIKTFQNNNEIACLCCRQAGKSTTVGAFALHFAIFNEDKYIGIASNKAASAKDILHRIKIMYEQLPFWLKPGVTEWNKTSVMFDNGTQIHVSATSPDAFRGRSINLLILDEFAFVRPNMARDFWAANYPALSSSKSSKVIIISTPNGLFNLFHEIYSNAESRKNTFVNIKYTWKAVPGRDEEWAAKQKSNLGDIKFRQEQEVEFLGSTATVIAPSKLEQLLSFSVDPVSLDLNGRLRVYERVRLPQRPNEKPTQYVIGVDCGKGTGAHDSTIQVLRVDSIKPIIKMEQVATFQSNVTDVYEFAGIVSRLSYYYNGAPIMVENNGEGAAVSQHLWWNYENMNLYCSDRNNIGIRSTKATKPRAVLLMKKLIEEDCLRVNDENTIKQLGAFIEEKGKFHGKDYPDDLVDSLFWACFSLECELFEIANPYQLINNQRNDNDNDVWGILSETPVSIEMKEIDGFVTDSSYYSPYSDQTENEKEYQNFKKELSRW